MAQSFLQLQRLIPEGSLLSVAETVFEQARRILSPAQPLPEAPNSTFALFRDPYRYVQKTCSRLGTDVFASRVFFRKTVFMKGQDAAELLYNRELFQREGAAPLRIQRTLFGRGGIQTTDGEEHRRRKAMFMGVLANPQQLQRLVSLAGQQLRLRAEHWPGQAETDLYQESRDVLTRAVCAWAGLPLPEEETGQRTAQLTALFDQAYLFGPPHWRSWWMRKKAERWCEALIEAVRAERLQAPEDSALAAVSWQRNADGTLLELRTAAVELLNFLRPVVAVSVYVVFLAMALQRHPEHRGRLQQDEVFVEAFVQEVRRYFPFFPMVAAITRRGFEWKNFIFPAGVRVMLDLYATNHDRRYWDAPDVFYPERFLRQQPGAFNLIPQGGGDAHVHHRCPGEALTIELMKEFTRFLSRDIRFDLADEDTQLQLNWQRLPPLPDKRFCLANVTMARAPRLPAPRRAAVNGKSKSSQTSH